MLINDKELYISTPFDNEDEIENVVTKYAEYLFGSNIIYLAQTRIKTIGGKGTIPDAIVIDFEKEEWYVVEAERAIHGTWDHIAPQVSKQLAAVESSETRDLILQIALKEIKNNKELKNLFLEIGIDELEIHGKLQKILKKRPTIAIPIDAFPTDLRDWAQTLKNTVKIWILNILPLQIKNRYYILYRKSFPQA